jgi:tRNA dimethylallyltransferase
VIELTGQPLSQLQGGARERFAWRVLKLVLMPADRAALHARIAERLDVMFAQGLLDEVRGLRARADPGSAPGQALHAELASMRAVGYRQIWQHLDGEFDLAECRARVIHATRQLAKRQMTWFRGDRDAVTVDPLDPGHVARAERAVADFLARPARDQARSMDAANCHKTSGSPSPDC